MINIILFLVIIVISFIVVRIGAIAFELTGLTWDQAKFQALSCFTATGFTTREAELITTDPRRRRIASILMIFGNAGLVTLIATLVNTLRPSNFMDAIELPLIHRMVPVGAVPWIKLGIIVLAVYGLVRLFSHAGLRGRLTAWLRQHMVKREMVKRSSFEELLIGAAGYGVTQIDITSDLEIAGRALRESGLRALDVTVLAVERKGGLIPNPPADTRLLAGDRLFCFGKLDRLREVAAQKG